MIDEPTEELAALYAVGLLDREESAAFEARMAAEQELALLVARVQAAATAEARILSPVEPPAEVRRRLLEEIRPHPAPAWSQSTWLLALAACIAVLTSAAALVQWNQEKANGRRLGHRIEADNSALAAARADFARLQGQQNDARQIIAALQAQLASSAQQIATLRARDDLSQIEIATLTSQLQNSPQAVAFVAWDPAQQRGVLKTANLPAARSDQDYQLWIVDPKYKLPVNAGVLPVGGGVSPPAQFRPDQPISKVAAFALSLERKGGVPVRQGPIVLIGE